MKEIFYTTTAEETARLGEKIGRMLKNGDVVCLHGDMGAGKTVITAGICKGLGVEDCITSPTYTLVNEYTAGDVTIYHFDLYRLSGEDEVYDMGFDEYIGSDGICIIEWPDRAGGLIPEKCGNITVEKSDDDTGKRRITVEI